MDYKFKDYLKLVIAKVFPAKGVLLIPQEQLIVGQQAECELFLHKAQRELEIL